MPSRHSAARITFFKIMEVLSQKRGIDGLLIRSDYQILVLSGFIENVKS